jgi:osmotically-inducible protein OsmY
MADQDRWRDDRGERRRDRGYEDQGRSGGHRGRGREGYGREGYGREGYGGHGDEDRGPVGLGGYGAEGYGAAYGRDEGGYGREDRDYGGMDYGDRGYGRHGSYGTYGSEGYKRRILAERGYAGERSRDDRGGGRGRDERGWWDRAADEVSSWFGDEEAERRRREVDHRGRGPRGYRRSDERVREDVSDRLYDDPFVDASDIEVGVSGGEVTLSGTVDSREARRRAEDLAEGVSGVTHVQNNLRVRPQGSAAGASGGTGAGARPPGDAAWAGGLGESIGYAAATGPTGVGPTGGAAGGAAPDATGGGPTTGETAGSAGGTGGSDLSDRRTL